MAERAPRDLLRRRAKILISDFGRIAPPGPGRKLTYLRAAYLTWRPAQDEVIWAARAESRAINLRPRRYAREPARAIIYF